MNDVFQIGTAKAKPGERAYGEVFVTTRVDGTPISIPIILVRGKTPGPILCLNGCIHGDEFSGMESIVRIANELDPEELVGTLVAVPVVNQPALEDSFRQSHYDHLNLNRIFPGDPNGTLTQKIADKFLNEIVTKCTAMVDLHGGGGYSRITQVVVAQGGYEELAWELALATGFDLVWLGGPWGGTGRLSALKLGIPAITVESGGGMLCSEADVAVHYNTSKNIMRHLGMIPGKAEFAKKYRVVTGGMTYASKGGFFHPKVEVGQDLKTGDLLGTITDMYGRLIEEVRVPTDGVAIEVHQGPSLNPGTVVCIFGEIKEVRERSL